MRFQLVLCCVLLASPSFAKEPKPRQSGKILQMESVSCGVDENSGKSVVGEIIGTDSAHKKTHELLCQEYVLQADKVIYRIRPGTKSTRCCCPSARRRSSAWKKTS